MMPESHVSNGERRLSQNSIIDRGFSNYLSAYNQPAYDFNINFARLFVCSFLVWKLLSRDFGFFGTLPSGAFYFYPSNIYPSHSYILWTGIPVLQEILTFHWVHWLLPHPGPMTMRVIQGAAVASLVAVAIWGKGPRSALLVLSYVLLIYLWGYLFLLGQEIDSVDLYFGILIALAISTYRDVPVWRVPSLFNAAKTVDAGRSYSNLILVLVFYYFASGMRKLTDLSPMEWFQYNLVEAIEQHSIRAANGPLATLDIFTHVHGLTFLDYIGPPAVYLSHLLVPTVFFRRSLVLKFFVFYAIFHVLTFGVGISFAGYIFIWSVIFPWREIFSFFSGRTGPTLQSVTPPGGKDENLL